MLWYSSCQLCTIAMKVNAVGCGCVQRMSRESPAPTNQEQFNKCQEPQVNPNPLYPSTNIHTNSFELLTLHAKSLSQIFIVWLVTLDRPVALSTSRLLFAALFVCFSGLLLQRSGLVWVVIIPLHVQAVEEDCIEGNLIIALV